MAVAILLAAATGIAMDRTGPWYDEFYTLAVTRPGLPFGELFVHHWLSDNHPPLFYMLAWVTNGLGETVQPRRWLNFAVLVVAVAALIGLGRRDPERQKLLACYALGLASSLPTIFYAAELRSNFLSLASASVAIAMLALVAMPGRERARPAQAGLFLALLAAFNVHYVTTALTGAIVLAFAVRLLAAGDRRTCLHLIGVAALAALPLAVTTALQIGTIETNTRTFWIPSGITAARWAGEHMLVRIAVANLPLTLAGITGLILALRDGRGNEPLAVATTVMAGTGLGLLVLLALHLWRPIVIERYLVALLPAGMIVLATGAAHLFGRLRPVAATLAAGAIIIAASVSIVLNVKVTESRPSWLGTGRLIADAVRRCPDAAVHANMGWNRPVTELPPSDNRVAMPLAYASVADELGFRLEPASSRRLSPRCPTLFWTEHVASLRPTADEVASRLRAQGYAIGKARLYRIGRGWVLAAEPAGQSPP